MIDENLAEELNTSHSYVYAITKPVSGAFGHGGGLNNSCSLTTMRDPVSNKLIFIPVFATRISAKTYIKKHMSNKFCIEIIRLKLI